jgi:Tol biopolymer transport system component
MMMVTLDPNLIEEQLKRILASQEFSRADRMARFLVHVVACSREGRVDGLKERSIGIEVFDRSSDWDPKLDNIVRGEARRLRTKLERYYLNAGAGELVHITIPKGAYTPQFSLLERPAPASTANPQPIRSSGWRYALVLPLVFLGIVSLIRRQSHTVAVAGSGLAPAVAFANEIGTEMNPAISADGKLIAYAWDGNGNGFDIYVKPADGGPDVAPQRITHSSSPELNPSFSPDSKKLAFLRVAPDETLVVIRDLSDGSESIAATLHKRGTGWIGENLPYADVGPSWLPDGKSLVVADLVTRGESAALYRVFLSGEPPRLILRTEREVKDYFPKVSPDGRHLAFVRYLSHGVSDLYVCEMDGSKLRRLTNEGRAIVGLAWAADGRSLLYSTWRQGSNRIWKVAIDSNSSPVPLPDSTDAADLATGPASDFLAYTAVTENWNIWRIPIREHGPGNPQRVIASSGRNHGPAFSPDGKLLAFISDRGGDWQIWLADADARNQRQLTRFQGNFLGCVTWSPDSRRIAFDGRPNGNSNIFWVDVSQGGVPEALDANGFEERMPFWSADGQFLYYNSNRDGRVAVWRRRLADGLMTKVGLQGSFKSMSSAGADPKLYFSLSRGPIFEAGLDGSAPTALPDATAIPDINWVHSGDALYFTRQEPNEQILFFELRDGKTRPIRRVTGSLVRNTSNLAVSPDREWLLYAQRDHASSDIVVRRPNRSK